MKTIKTVLFTFLCLFYSLNHAFSQNLKKNPSGTNTNSHIFELGNNDVAKIGIGTTSPFAKLHIQSKPDNDTSVVKIDAVNTVHQVIGSVQNWLLRDDIYYGIFQSQVASSPSPRNYLQNYLGLGVEKPNFQLDVNGIIGCSGTNATGLRINNTNQPFVFQYVTTGNGGSNEENQDEGEPGGGVTAITYPLTINSLGIKVENYLECTSLLSTNSLKIQFNPMPGSVFVCNDAFGQGFWSDTSVFSVRYGRVGIGTENNFPDYKLTVNGKVLCTEMKVRLRTQWSDYVFQDDYNLRPLTEVEEFISTNKHLPEVPTAKEVAENGFNVGEMNALMLKKIEELTLYIIALQKEVDQLKTKSGSR